MCVGLCRIHKITQQNTTQLNDSAHTRNPYAQTTHTQTHTLTTSHTKHKTAQYNAQRTTHNSTCAVVHTLHTHTHTLHVARAHVRLSLAAGPPFCQRGGLSLWCPLRGLGAHSGCRGGGGHRPIRGAAYAAAVRRERSCGREKPLRRISGQVRSGQGGRPPTPRIHHSSGFREFPHSPAAGKGKGAYVGIGVLWGLHDVLRQGGSRGQVFRFGIQTGPE